MIQLASVHRNTGYGSWKISFFTADHVAKAKRVPQGFDQIDGLVVPPDLFEEWNTHPEILSSQRPWPVEFLRRFPSEQEKQLMWISIPYTWRTSLWQRPNTNSRPPQQTTHNKRLGPIFFLIRFVEGGRRHLSPEGSVHENSVGKHQGKAYTEPNESHL